MYTCVLCKFPAELDDTVAPTAGGRCICLSCFHHQVSDERRLDGLLLRQLEVLLAPIASAG